MENTPVQASLLPPSHEWEMMNFWNENLGRSPERPAVERDRLWASELGKPDIELFLKLKGVQPSNPPNNRAKAKFVAGNLFEWIIAQVLKRAGILKQTQTWVPHQYTGMLNVTGKIDFLAGGIPDVEKFRAQLESMDLPSDFMQAAEAVVDGLRKKFPNGLADKYLEIKSCSQWSMNSMEKTGRSSKNHRLQLFHYLKSNNYKHGTVVYICRDDLRMFEVKVENPSSVEDEYKSAISSISKYYYAHMNTPVESFIVGEGDKRAFVWMEGMPQIEQYIVWDEDYGKFSRNWGVEYSSYLTMLYGFATQLEFEEAVNPIVSRWNRVLARVKKAQMRKEWLDQMSSDESRVFSEKIEGKRTKKQYVLDGEDRVFLPDEIQSGYDMTPKNLEVLEEIKTAGFDVDELMKTFAGEEEEVVE